MSGNLIQKSPDDQRLYLDDEPVHNGDGLQVLLENGMWLPVRVEGMPHQLTGYLHSFEGLPESTNILELSPLATYRWPGRASA